MSSLLSQALGVNIPQGLVHDWYLNWFAMISFDVCPYLPSLGVNTITENNGSQVQHKGLLGSLPTERLRKRTQNFLLIFYVARCE